MNEIMKRVRGSLMVLGIALFAMTGLAATNDVSGMLQKGLFEEEANRNLDAAIQAYQGVIAQTDKDRKFAATAIFRLGECYRKLGKTNEATAQYERIVREFSDQTELVKLSQGYVGSGGKTARPQPAVASSQPQPVGLEDAEIERLKRMLKDSPDLINAYDQESGGTTPLNRAVKAGQLKVVKFLLENKANVEARNKKNGQTPLITAAESGNGEMVDLLLDNGADVNAFQNLSQQGFTALHHAAARGYRAITEDLIAHKASVNTQDSGGQTPLYLTVQKGYLSVADLLLKNGAAVNQKNQSGFTPLSAAAAIGNYELVKLLLAKGAEVNSKDINGWTPLFAAIGSENKAGVIKLLLEHGADVNMSSNGGETPLIRAVSCQNSEVVKFLIEHGADVNAKITKTANSYPAWSALDFAVNYRDQKSAELLLEHKADPDAKVRYETHDGGIVRVYEEYTPLHIAVSQGDKSMVELLLKYKADSNTANRSGDTPLLLAISLKQRDIVELLVSRGADLNIVSENETTPLLSSIYYFQDLEMARFLIARGANVNAEDKLGRSVLDRIEEWNTDSDFKDAVMKLLRDNGAVSALEMTTIRATRPGLEKPLRFFRKDKEGVNRYSLLELIGKIYYGNNGYWGFPDFNKATIIRRAKEAGKTERIQVALGDILESGDCSKDVWLEWGDVVEIPETDHRVSESWSGLSRGALETLLKCTERVVQIQIKGQTNAVLLRPFIYSLAFPTTYEARTNVDLKLNSARLRQVVSESKMVLASSDLARVKVRHHDPVTKKVEERVFDLREGQNNQNATFSVRAAGAAPLSYQWSNMGSVQVGQSYDSETDLWLRDGDVIEIPEKQ